MGENTCPSLVITFSPAWWHEKYGMDFSQRVWQDPIMRTERDREKRRLLFDRFGDVGLGEKDPAPRPNIEAYGDRLMAAFYGCEIRYLADQEPAAIPFRDAKERMKSFEPPGLDTSPVVKKAFEDARILEDTYGFCDGNINFGSPLNNAVSLFGEEILSSCASEPECAKVLLKTMARGILAVFDRLVCKINKKSCGKANSRGWLGMGNCPVCMLSPGTYRDVVLPSDLWLREKFCEFTLHHCGIFHPYGEVYRALRIDALELGWGTDLRATRRVYPTTPLTLQIQAKELVKKTKTELRKLVDKVLGDAEPLEYINSILVAEVGCDIADETVCNLMAEFKQSVVMWGEP